MRIPDKEVMISYAKYYAWLSVAFFIVYGGANYLASHRIERYRFFLPIELHTPFVPESILIYLSVCAIFILPVFYINKAQVMGLAKAFMFCLLVAGCFFILLPAELAHERTDDIRFMPALFSILYTLALPHNLMPSLHIAFTVLFLSVCHTLEKRAYIRYIFILWGLLLFASVLLMRQHQLIDIPTGALLGWVAYRFVYQRSLR